MKKPPGAAWVVVVLFRRRLLRFAHPRTQAMLQRQQRIEVVLGVIVVVLGVIVIASQIFCTAGSSASI
jgi:undecaprenyl pyrophosphate phosphatase UppP